MKKNVVIGIIIAIVVVGIVVYFYPSQNCAQEGEQFSVVYEEYPDTCCEGLTEWHSGFDTRISIADECYETNLLSGSPIGTCINCGNNVCEDLENPCNCPEDCVGKGKSRFSLEEFCSEGYDSFCEFIDSMNEELCSLCQ